MSRRPSPRRLAAADWFWRIVFWGLLGLFVAGGIWIARNGGGR